eukprot:gene17653-biopygen20391
MAVGGSVRPAGRSARPRPLRPPVRPAAPPAHASHAMEFEATGAFRTRPGCVLSRFSQGGRWCYNRLSKFRVSSVAITCFLGKILHSPSAFGKGNNTAI